MFQISLMVFREILEIAIIIGVLCAVTKELKNRSYWIFSGAAMGILGSVALAFFMKSISQSFSGHGKELFNATILLFASLMIGCTVIWMQTHAREINTKLKEVGKAIENKEKSLDRRDYRVSFKQVKDMLGFEPQYSVEDGINEVIKLLNDNKKYLNCDALSSYGNFKILDHVKK